MRFLPQSHVDTIVVAMKSDSVVAAPKASVEVSKVEGMEVTEGKDEVGRKTVNVVAVEKEVVTKTSNFLRINKFMYSILKDIKKVIHSIYIHVYSFKIINFHVI